MVPHLDFQDNEVPEDNHMVLVEGVKTGVDSIAVDWVGETKEEKHDD